MRSEDLSRRPLGAVAGPGPLLPPVRLAIVGCGVVADEHHLPAALGSPNVQVAALVDRDIERARLLARKYGCGCELHTSLEAVAGRIEAVLIATPNAAHAPVARVALERGLPVLIEKPMATTYSDAVALCELARRNGSFISVGFMTRHFPVVALFKKLLDDGRFGRPLSFHFEYGTRGGWAPVSGYNLDSSQSGGGVLVVSGTHFLDRMLFWFGYPSRFRYFDDSYGGVEANCRVEVEFPSGLVGSIVLSKTVQLRNCFFLETDRYFVELPWAESERLTLRPRDDASIEETVRSRETISRGDAFRVQIEEFARIIRHGGQPTVSGEIGSLSVKLCEELYACRRRLAEPWLWYAKRLKS